MTDVHTMKALRAHERGGPERLVYGDAPRPVPGSGEVSVAVRAAGITFAELTWPETWESHGEDRTPIIPSHEVAGVVAEVGQGVTDLAVGDSVFGLVPFDRDGAAAEFVVVPAVNLARIADEVSAVTAAAAVLPGLTAREALHDQGGIAAGQRVLVRGGVGAVGAFLTQVAKAAGAEVTVTVTSPADEGHARDLGASTVIVVPRGDAPDGLAGFDIAVDAVGGDVPEWMYAAPRADGRLIVLQEPPDEALAAKHGIDARFFVVSADAARLGELAADLAADRLQVTVAETFPLSQGRAAYESGSSRARPSGKTVILVP